MVSVARFRTVPAVHAHVFERAIHGEAASVVTAVGDGARVDEDRIHPNSG